MWSSGLGQKCEQKKHKDDKDSQADPEADHYRVYKTKNQIQDMMNDGSDDKSTQYSGNTTLRELISRGILMPWCERDVIIPGSLK